MNTIKEFEDLIGRAKSNLSQTFKILERYGIVELHKDNRNVIPEVKASDFLVEFGVAAYLQ